MNVETLMMPQTTIGKREPVEAITVPAEIYTLLESIAELPGPSWREVTNLMQDSQAAYAAVVHASPLITGELARLALENGLIKPQNSNLN